MTPDELQDMRNRAARAVEDQPRHDSDSLFNLLMREFPAATDEELDEAISFALGA